MPDGWMPWKWMLCAWLPLLVKRMRSRSPSVQRIVGPGHLAVVGPGGIEHPGGHLDLAILGHELVLAQRLSGRETRDRAAVEAGEERRRVEGAGGELAHGDHVVVRALGRALRRCALPQSLKREPARAGGQAHGAEGTGPQGVAAGDSAVSHSFRYLGSCHRDRHSEGKRRARSSVPSAAPQGDTYPRASPPTPRRFRPAATR